MGTAAAMTPWRGPVQLNLRRDILSVTAEFSDFQEPKSYRSEAYQAALAKRLDATTPKVAFIVEALD